MVSNLMFIVRRRWLILVSVPLLAVAAVFLLTSGAPKAPTRYTTTVYLAADPQQVDAISLQQAAVDIRREDVAQAAADTLGITDPNLGTLPSKVKTKVDPESLTIKLTATDADREYVKKYVEAFAGAFITVNQNDLNQTFDKDLEKLEKERDEAQLELSRFLQANAAALNRVPPDAGAVVQQGLLQDRAANAEQRVLEQQDAEVESPFRLARTDPVTLVAATKLQLPESRPVRSLLAFMLACVGAIVVVAIIEKLNPRVDNPLDAERIVDGPVLAMVPIMSGKRHKIIERADLSGFTGPFAESFRSMRSHLDFRVATEKLDRPPCVMIVSSAPGEGKTTSTAFLALSFSEVGRDVLVVGADFRRPAVHRLFGVPRSPGLSSRLLAGDGPDRSENIVRSIVKRDERTGVRVIPSGPGTDRVTGLLGDLNAVASAGLASGCTVVIDTAPVMVANDAIDFLPMVDWVIVVVRLGRTTQRSLTQTIANLRLNNATIAGCIMIGSLESSDAKRYYYSYYKVDEGIDDAGTPRPEPTDPLPPVTDPLPPAAGPAPAI